jgi:hypothetical protein
MHPSYIPCSWVGVEKRQTLHVDVRCNKQHVCVCVCVCVRGEEMGTERKGEAERERERES